MVQRQLVQRYPLQNQLLIVIIHDSSSPDSNMYPRLALTPHAPRRLNCVVSSSGSQRSVELTRQLFLHVSTENEPGVGVVRGSWAK